MTEKAIEAAAKAIFNEWHTPSTLRRGGRTLSWDTSPTNTQAAFMRDAHAAITAYLSYKREEGFALMPREATLEMTNLPDAWVWLIDPDTFKAQCSARVWRAMWDAAGGPP